MLIVAQPLRRVDAMLATAVHNRIEPHSIFFLTQKKFSMFCREDLTGIVMEVQIDL